jgi:HSP20 family molecular chaperone IbpA
LVVYEPQYDSWKKDKLEARSVVSAALPGVKDDVLGVVTYSARTNTDKAKRLVELSM